MGLGIVLGAGLGGLGSFLQAREEKKQFEDFKSTQRQALQSARDFAGGTSVTTGQGRFGDRGFGPSAKQIRQEKRRVEKEGGVFDVAEFTDEFIASGQGRPMPTFIDPVTGERRQGGRVEEILADPLLVSARGFLQGTFDNAADSPLAQDFAKGIRAAQASRGTLFGGASIGTEAGGLAAFSQRLRQDLLPSALQFGTLGENLRQSVLGFESNLRTLAGTGFAPGNFQPTANPLGAALSGALSGGAAGFGLQREFGSQSTNQQLGVNQLDPQIQEAILQLLQGAG